MKLTILGSGTTVPSKERAAPGYLLDVGDKLYLIDSGEGTKRRIAEAKRDFSSIDGIFYTHTHVDHVAELPAILWAYNWKEQARKRDLHIFGPIGFTEFFDKMLEAFWPQFNEKGKFKVVITEMGTGDQNMFGGLIVSAQELDKQGNTLIKNAIGYRFEYNDDSFVFTGDVGYNKDVISLAKNASVLMTEAASPIPTRGHLTPVQAGELASKAMVKKLILTHFYPAVEKIDILDEATKEFDGEVIIAEDLMEINI